MKSPHNDRTGFWRLSHAARMAGITPEALEAASKAGKIPVSVERIGPRNAYVRAEEFSLWLKGDQNK